MASISYKPYHWIKDVILIANKEEKKRTENKKKLN
jgi:hypothetical protein